MKPVESPKRTSSRIKAMAKANTAIATEEGTGTTAAPIDAIPIDTTIKASQSSRATPVGVVVHGFQAPPLPPPSAAPAAALATTAQATVSLNPKLSGQPRQNSHAAPPPPYHPAMSSAAQPHHHPPHGPPPPYAPPPYPSAAIPPSTHPKVDSKTMEERKRNALAYAMQDHVGGAKAVRGRTTRRGAAAPAGAAIAGTNAARG
eukprot:CAMPEP_0172322236 /NCGR_PEP_ID=MMETSP1058-20130122/45395_1 /TAXON_ID=83371 /ORGANISM="Detonula confervacea, Strain CCMP 353" /LENGTH=202 /DNA_ID=CAMNT_0013037935 /DNA_START=122 /DNA_END=726 /DNA_ORIENTATION=+